MPTTEQEHPPAHCALCGRELTAKERDICRGAPDRFDGKLLCEEHQRRFSACRAVRGR